MALGAIGTLTGGILGGIAGGQGSTTSQGLRVNLAPESELEKYTGNMLQGGLKDLQSLVNVGPGQQDVQAGVNSQRALAELLKQLQQTGGAPQAQDLSNANSFVNSLFAPQQQALQQQFADMQVQGNRSMAKMGRGPGDVVMQNKLNQEFARQMQGLQSQMTAGTAQYAQQFSDNRLNFANQFAQVNSGLASQALANRQALMGMGSQLRSSEQNFRAGTASKEMTTSSGGGLMGTISGALGMSTQLGAGLSQLGDTFSGLFSKKEVNPFNGTGPRANFGN